MISEVMQIEMPQTTSTPKLDPAFEIVNLFPEATEVTVYENRWYFGVILAVVIFCLLIVIYTFACAATGVESDLFKMMALSSIGAIVFGIVIGLAAMHCPVKELKETGKAIYEVRFTGEELPWASLEADWEVISYEGDRRFMLRVKEKKGENATENGVTQSDT